VLVTGEDLPVLEEVMETRVAEARMAANRFFELREDAFSKIYLQVVPDKPIGECVYFNSAKVIVPKTRTSRGYSVIELFTKRCESGDLGVEAKVLEEGLKTSEEALEKHVNPNVIQTVAYARGVRSFPLYETVVPLICEIYKQKAGRTETSKKMIYKARH
jgi:hypothetical protein